MTLLSSISETPETDSYRVSEENLRECPFCGGEATVHNYPNVTSGRDWFVHCKPCDMSLDAFSTRAEAIAAWNRRTTPSLPPRSSTETDKADPAPAMGGEVETLHFTADWLVRGMPVKTPGSNRRGRVASEVTFDGKVYVDYPAGGGAYWPATDLQPWESHRDVLGRLVRDAWVKWARSQPNPKASWLVPYDDLPEADKEADRQIGEALTTAFPPVLTAALRRDEGKGVREALEALRPFVEAFAKADDPGVSDLYDEQPFSLHVNLGAWRRARSAWRALSASPAPEEQDYFGSLVERARAAAAKASVKFPQPNYVTLKIAEEAGEVVRGAVHYAENRMEWSEVEGEVVQLLAMLIRFVTEGDEINGVKPPAPLPRSTPGGAK